MDTLTKIVGRYHDQESWKGDTVFLEESFTLLQDILEEAGELSERAPYADLINTEFATKVAK